MPTLLEVKFTGTTGKRETDTRVELVDVNFDLNYAMPSTNALAKLRPGDEVTEVIVAYRGKPGWERKFDPVRVAHVTDLGNGRHAVGLEAVEGGKIGGVVSEQAFTRWS